MTDFDIKENCVTCEGPLLASSESLTHASIYELDPATNAIAHVQNDALWQELYEKLPTTNTNVAYGTPEMAEAAGRILEVAATRLLRSRPG